MSFWKILAYSIGAAIIGVVVFVRPSQLGASKTGGEQASDVINASATGFAGIIKAATGLSS
jgi:hypothetical protein